MSITLFPYQKEALKNVLEKEKYALFMEQGTGKTMVAIKAMETLHKQGKIDRVVIFVPKGILYNWVLEMKDYLETDYVVETLTQKKRAEKDQALKEFIKLKTPKLKILLLNYEKSFGHKKDLKKFRPDMFIADESHKLKGRSTSTGRAIYSLTRSCDYRILMTGTPILNGPEDLFMQFKIMNDELFGTRWKDFEEEYIVKGGFMGKVIVGYRNEEQLQQVLEEHSFRVKIDEVRELPPINMSYYTVELSNTAQKAYKELKETMLTRIDRASEEVPRKKLKAVCRQNGIQYHPRESYHSLLMKTRDFVNVTSCDLVVTQLIKLQQVTGGFLKQDDGEVVPVDDSKLKAVQELVNDSTRPVLIFCRYIAEIESIKEALMPHKRVGVYRGSNQKQVYEDFRNGELDVMILQIQSGSLGLNLQRASRLIFYSWNFSSGDYVQAIARIKRNGQKNPMEVIHLVAEDTIDEEMLTILQSKRKIASRILRD